ncbi:MAG: DUF2332 domain-containing protein [Pseudomonadales bacterium]|nr:DUF2332 domain-containing protein [Pseudomonadales bacterium]
MSAQGAQAPSRAELLQALSLQAVACERLGSPLTARVLGALGASLEGEGALAPLLADWRLPPVPSALALRLAGALHALVLDGAAPDLARFYPDATASPEAPDPGDDRTLRRVVEETLAAHGPVIADFLAQSVQTNEVQRSAVLLPGLLEIARRVRAPLRLLELGASGGLNLLLDRWHYRFGRRGWGPPDAPLRLAPAWSGPAPPLEAPLAIRSRRGVDLHPLDFRDDAVVRRGLAYLWPDQRERTQRFRIAVAAFRASAVRVEEADVAQWLPSALAERAGEGPTVVQHSIFWQYLPAETRRATEAAIRDAGDRATEEAPVAWLRYEPEADGRHFELTLDLWPGPGERIRLARAHPHGASVDWVGETGRD